MGYNVDDLRILKEWQDDSEPELAKEYDGADGYTYYVIVDSTAIPAHFDEDEHFGKGGMRYTEDLNMEEMERLASRMSIKNALPVTDDFEGLYGGAKAGIRPPEGVEIGEDDGNGDRGLPERVVENFAKKTWELHRKSEDGGPWGGPGCDVNVEEDTIKQYLDALLESGKTDDVRIATGRKNTEKYKGVPYDDEGIAGEGVYEFLEVVLDYVEEHPDEFPGIPVKGSYDIALQGLGNMGKPIAERIAEGPHTLVAASEVSFDATVIDDNGLAVQKVLDAHDQAEDDSAAPGLPGEEGDLYHVLYHDCDVLIPAAAGDVIDEKNASQIQAPLVVEAANFPVTDAARQKLYDRGTLVTPDASANFGGSVAASVGLDPSVESGTVVQRAHDLTIETIRTHAEEVLDVFLNVGGFDDGCPPHVISEGLAATRIAKAKVEQSDDVPDEIEEIVT